MNQAKIIAGYGDGLYEWSQTDWNRFPTEYHLAISVLADPGFACFDSEAGNASQAQVASAVFERHRNGKRSLIYCNTSDYPSQVQACDSAGVPRLAWDWWAANYSNGDVIPAGAVGVQYQGGMSAAYDVSVMDATWCEQFFGLSAPASKPATPVAPTPIPFDLEDFLDMINDPVFATRFLYRFLLLSDVGTPTLEANVKAIESGQSLGSIFEALQSSDEGQKILEGQRKAAGL